MATPVTVAASGVPSRNRMALATVLMVVVLSIAPYIGVSWLRSYGQTGRIARQQGESSDAVAFVAGIRIWF